ncbi:alpha/beta hydrolase family protein [Palleronia sp. KMU-117]|uniref:alpha/beta hydrolase family protein n=1 Tax=Palleronia sp. KMU-117 TaxID=3434108 RepID=UPI003D7545C3
MTPVRLSLLSAALLAPIPSFAAEDVVTIPSPGGEIVATLSLPEGDPAPVVLLLHGFTGSRNELSTESVPEGIFARTAARLADAGYASLRVDFRGSGESLADLTFAETTFEGQTADALAALEYLSAHEGVAGDDIFVIGWSQGGLVATAAAGRSDLPDAVALWAAVATPPSTYAGILGADLVDAAIAGDADTVHAVTLPWGAEIELKGAFFDGVATFDPAAEIADYAGPLFVAQGSLDDTVPPASAEVLIAAHDGPEELWVAEMDHVFNAFSTDETLEAMIAATIAYFDAHAD